MGWLSSLFTAVGSVFNWMTGRNATVNSPAMQQAAADKSEQKQVDASTAAVKNQDTDEIRKELAD